MPAPFGRSWVFLSRGFLGASFQFSCSQAEEISSSPWALQECALVGCGVMLLVGLGLPGSSEQALSEENEGERPSQGCPPYFKGSLLRNLLKKHGQNEPKMYK